MTEFTAGVQYNDVIGSAAADHGDNVKLTQHLEREGLMAEGEILAGLRIASGENHGTDEVTEVSVVAYLYTSNQFERNPTELRAVEFSMPVTVLFSNFKRLDIVMMANGLDPSAASVSRQE